MTSKQDNCGGVHRARVLLARSLGDVALLIGCAQPETVTARAGVCVSFNPKSQADLNQWASAVLGREVRGDVVVLMVEA